MSFKQLKTIFTAAGFVLTTSLAGISGSVFALTPDGETPANEGVCDELQYDGVPKGLYGLCVAYCEAQDLNEFDKKPPSVKILDNYNKKLAQAGMTEPAMPCIHVETESHCPCWTAEELASVTADGQVATCIGGDSVDKIQMIDNAPLTKFADADRSIEGERCRYIDLNTSPWTIRSFSITPEEAQDCVAEVLAACNSVALP